MEGRIFSEKEERTLHAAAKHVYDHAATIMNLIENNYENGHFIDAHDVFDCNEIASFWKSIIGDVAAAEKIINLQKSTQE